MERKAYQLIIKGLAIRLSAFILCLAFGSTAYAGIILNSLPYIQNFDTPEYDNANPGQGLVWTTQGATHTWMESGGWGGGGTAKFTPPVLDEGYSGLGQIHFPNANGHNRINVRFLLFHGRTWREYGPGNKVIILNREDGTDRPMIISREYENQHGTWVTYGACDGTVCNYQGGDYWPDGTDEFRIGDAPHNREEEWVSVEIEVFANEGIINLYIHTTDGALSGLYTSQTMARPGNAFRYMDILGGYMARAVQPHPDNYFMIDNLVVDDAYIGPPQGFTNPPPMPPTLLN